MDDFPPPAPIPLLGVIAIVGSDGAGKSTLMADLAAHLGRAGPVVTPYLGQGSGNILRAVTELPLVGPAIGRFLKRRGERAHAEDGAPAPPDAATAFVVHLLSRRRMAKFRRMLSARRGGAVTVVADRWPQAEMPGFYFDGPGLSVAEARHPLVRRLARREARLYARMAAYVPTLVIRLNIDADTAHARKPDHKVPMLREKARVIPTLSFNGACIHDLDARAPYPDVLRAAIAAVDAALRDAAG